MITAIRTHNFKKLENFSASFSDGTNLIVGQNAQGKSTSLDAIRFALFGAKGVSGTVPSLTTWGKSGMWVELDISGYTINRTNQNAKITDKDGKLVASGNSTCARFCEDLLGCSVKDFDLLYMSKQNETAGLITFGAAELNRKVEEYAGVAKIDKVVKSLGSQINGIQIALQSLQMIPVDSLQGEMDNLWLKIRSLEDDEQSLSEKTAEAKEGLDKSRSDLKKAKLFNQKQDEIAEQAALHQKKVDRAQTLLSEKTEQLKKALAGLALISEVSTQDIELARKELVKVRNSNAKLQSIKTTEAIEKEVAQAVSKLQESEVYQQTLVALEHDLEQAQKAYSEASVKFSEAQAEANRLKSEVSKAKVELESGICSGCKRPLEGHDTNEAAATLNIKKQEYSQAQELMAAMQDGLDKTKSAFSLANSNLKAHSATNPGSGWEEKLDKLKGELEQVSEERRSLEAVIADMPSMVDLESKLESLVSDQKLYQSSYGLWENANDEVKAAEAALSKLQSVDVNLPEPKVDTGFLEVAIEQLEKDFNLTNNELSSVRVSLASNKAELKGKVNQYEAAKANNQKVAELSEELDICKQLRNYLNEERGKFMNGVWRTILGTASHFINKSTSGWITQIGRDDKGDFTFTENGNVAVAKESASGAQKAFIGTAIKVGLAQAKMGSSSMVILDEPTADMRDDKASWLAAGLMMLPGQKIMVTHRDSERMVAQNVVYVGE